MSTIIRDTTPEEKAKIANNFTYHAPYGTQIERYAWIRANAGQLATDLCQRCPPSRELSLALTKLEEAVFWANAAIARNEGDGPA